MYNFLKQIINIPAVSGRESELLEKIRGLMAPYVDECSFDNLGNLMALKRGKSAEAKDIMLCAHADEIGFMATYIEDSGFIRVAPVGGINFVSASYSKIVFENGTKGVLVPEGKVSDPKNSDSYYVDIGADSKKAAEKKVKIGDVAVCEASLDRLMGKRIVGRPFDDRIGCAVLFDIARNLKDTENNVWFVFSTQEEVGCRGAKTAANRISPECALVFDVTLTGDTIGAAPMDVKLGEGAAIKIKDASVICDHEIVEKLTACAKNSKIPYQCEILKHGGTDTSSIQTAGIGVRAGALSIPTRYVHSSVETVDLKDAEACRDLALEFIYNY
jgi:endoglucanase